METARIVLLALLVAIAIWFAGYWGMMLSRRRQWGRPNGLQLFTGFLTDFGDTFGVGSFAVTTGIYRLTKSVDDRLIPGTLNVGHGLPTIAQALIFIAAVNVDIATLCLLILASVVGAWFGAGVVSKLPKRSVQLGMGLALLFAAVLMYLRIENAVPKAAEGEAVLALTGWKLGVGIVGNMIFGALMTIGVGAYAPIMVMVSLLGMDTTAAFPIMMGSCAFLMPTASYQFVRNGSYDPRAALGLTLLGIPGVIVASIIILGFGQDPQLKVLKYIVLLVVLYTSITMLMAAFSKPASSASASDRPESPAAPA